LNVATRMLIHTCKFKTANKTLPPLRIIVSRKNLTVLCVTQEFRGTQFEERWCRPSKTFKYITLQPIIKRIYISFFLICYISQIYKPLLFWCTITI